MTSKPTKPRNCLSRGGGNPRTNPARQHVNREIGDNLPKANVVRGLVPRWGRVGAWQNPPCQFAEPTHNSNFSYLGVQAQAGMSDWYENEGSRHPLSSFLPPTIVIPATHFLFPATHYRHSGPPTYPLSRHPLSSLRSPTSSFQSPPSSFRRRPESRRGGARGCYRNASKPVISWPTINV